MPGLYHAPSLVVKTLNRYRLSADRWPLADIRRVLLAESWQLEAGSWKLEAESWKLKAES